jgi:hypothetical protein
VPLATSSALVESGRVVDAATGAPCLWRPTSMVLVVSERLARIFTEGRYEELRAQARAGMSYRVDTAPRSVRP